MNDLAYHPDAVRACLDAVSDQFPDRRILAIFQPRITGPRGWPAQNDLAKSLGRAQALILLPPTNPRLLVPGEPFSLELLADQLRTRGKTVELGAAVDINPATLVTMARKDDVIFSSVQPSMRTHLVEAIEKALSSLRQERIQKGAG